MARAKGTRSKRGGPAAVRTAPASTRELRSATNKQHQSRSGTAVATASAAASNIGTRVDNELQEEDEDLEDLEVGLPNEQQARSEQPHSKNAESAGSADDDEPRVDEDGGSVTARLTLSNLLPPNLPSATNSRHESETQQRAQNQNTTNQATDVDQPAAGHQTRPGLRWTPGDRSPVEGQPSQDTLHAPDEHPASVPAHGRTTEIVDDHALQQDLLNPETFPRQPSPPIKESSDLFNDVGRTSKLDSAWSSLSNSSSTKRKALSSPSISGVSPPKRRNKGRSPSSRHQAPDVSRSDHGDEIDQDKAVSSEGDQDDGDTEDKNVDERGFHEEGLDEDLGQGLDDEELDDEEETDPDEYYKNLTAVEQSYPSRWQQAIRSLMARQAPRSTLETVRKSIEVARQGYPQFLREVKAARALDRPEEGVEAFGQRLLQCMNEGVEQMGNREKDEAMREGNTSNHGLNVDNDEAGRDRPMERRKSEKLQKDLGFLQPSDLLQPAHEDLAGRWNFNGTVGTGASGYAGRWVQYDSTGKVSRCVVLKDSYYNAAEWDLEDSNIWEDREGRIPKEHHLQRRLNRCPESHNIVKCYAYHVHHEQRMIRLYLEDCPHGDLEEVIRRHAHARDSLFDAGGTPLPSRIPLPVLWCVFEALVSAVCFMTSGSLPLHPEINGWRSILQRDIKPANIFLGLPHDRIWPGVPMPKLGDFGLVVEIERGVVPGGSGTDAYKAPERWTEGDEEFQRALDNPLWCTSSDIWSVGRVLHDLMALRRADANLQEEPERLTSFSAEDEEFYTRKDSTLLGLVKSCLEPPPFSRPGAANLWGQIQRKVGSYRDFSLARPPMKTEALHEDEIFWYKQASNDLWVPE